MSVGCPSDKSQAYVTSNTAKQHYMQAYVLNEMESDVKTDPELQNSIHVGIVKAAALTEFKNSMDKHCTIYKSPRQKVTVRKAFETGNCVLVALSNSVAIVADHKVKESSKSITIGRCFDHPDGTCMVGVVKHHLTFPTKSTKTDVAIKSSGDFLVAYWACTESFDPVRANMRREFRNVSTVVGATTIKTKVPVLVNMKSLKADDELVILKVSHDSDDDEPAAKKPRLGGGRGKANKGKGKGRGKGRGSAKAKAKK